MSPNKFLLLINTIRYLQPKQVFYRLKLIFFGFAPPKKKITYKLLINRPKKWVTKRLWKECVSSDDSLNFLNEKGRYIDRNTWNSPQYSKLWLYNLHYFNDLNSFTADKNKALHIRFLDLWIKENPITEGIGWEPYTLSLRIINITKAWLSGLEITSDIKISLYNQAEYLSHNLEYHLLGNHYFSNLKALFFSGIVFENKAWIDLSKKYLQKEIDEQILPDGGHFELSPMYQALAMTDLLDIYNLVRSVNDPIYKDFEKKLKNNILKMYEYLNLVSHPDEGYAFFNDSVNGIAPSKKIISEYMSDLDLSIEIDKEDALSILHLSDSGLYVARNRFIKIIFDVGHIGANYIPGHAHADTLSFETSVCKQRVIVNSGISTYKKSKERLNQRKTLSHNTVEIDGKDSSQVWDSFRVANRAKVLSVSKEIKNNELIMRGEHDGYSKLFSKVIHSRELKLSDTKLSIEDKIKGPFIKAVSRYYFHPSLDIRIDNGKLLIKGKGFLMTCSVKNKKIKLIPSTWHPEFGKSLNNFCLEISFTSKKLFTEFEIYYNDI